MRYLFYGIDIEQSKFMCQRQIMRMKPEGKQQVDHTAPTTTLTVNVDGKGSSSTRQSPTLLQRIGLAAVVWDRLLLSGC